METDRVPYREGFAQGPKGLRLFWRVDGEAGPWLACLNGIGVTMKFWEPFARRMATSCRVLRWDYRGHGRSDCPKAPGEVGVAHLADDYQAIARELGIGSAVLLGHSMGTQVALEVHRRAPGMLAGLVPTLGFHRKGLDIFLGSGPALAAFHAAKKLVEKAPGLMSRVARPILASGVAERFARMTGLIDSKLAPHDLMVPFMEQLIRMDLRTYVALAEDMQRYDGSELLKTVRVPTLVIAAERDSFVPASVAQELSAGIEGAELFVIPGGTHAALIEQPDLLSLRVAKFLDERVFPKSQTAE